MSQDSHDEELLRAVAELADLPLSAERVAELAPIHAAIGADHALLRFLPADLEPHMVFDPRWD